MIIRHSYSVSKVKPNNHGDIMVEVSDPESCPQFIIYQCNKYDNLKTDEQKHISSVDTNLNF